MKALGDLPRAIRMAFRIAWNCIHPRRDRRELIILRDTLVSNFKRAFPARFPGDSQDMIELLAATVMVQRQDIRALRQILAAVRARKGNNEANS